MKVYTGAGDHGETSLLSGERVAKNHERIEAFGDVDELNSIIGAVAAVLPPEHADLAEKLQNIQSDLLTMGAWLATTPGAPSAAKLAELDATHPRKLEAAIDRMQENLTPLQGFILPGGHVTAAMAHVGRAICRRAERRVVSLSNHADEGVAAEQLRLAMVYLNRLSDYLFVLARHCNRILGEPEVLWGK